MNTVKNSIGWADYTWNPITGCKRKCKYCYARKIHKRFYKTPFSDIVFHQERLFEPEKVSTPSKIFVGSMSDNEFWTKDWWSDIIRVCKMCPQHTFMFLTKGQHSYKNVDMPENCMQGITIEYPSYYTTQIIHAEECQRPFVSFEPLLGKMYDWLHDNMELAIVGAMTGPGAVVPEFEWIESIRNLCPPEKVYWKNNIKKYL